MVEKPLPASLVDLSFDALKRAPDFDAAAEQFLRASEELGKSAELREREAFASPLGRYPTS